MFDSQPCPLKLCMVKINAISYFLFYFKKWSIFNCGFTVKVATGWRDSNELELSQFNTFMNGGSLINTYIVSSRFTAHNPIVQNIHPNVFAKTFQRNSSRSI